MPNEYYHGLDLNVVRNIREEMDIHKNQFCEKEVRKAELEERVFSLRSKIFTDMELLESETSKEEIQLTEESIIRLKTILSGLLDEYESLCDAAP